MRGRLASDRVFSVIYNLVIYTLLACAKQASHTHMYSHTVTHTPRRPTIWYKIIDGMTVQMYETLYSRSLHGTDRKFCLPVWLQHTRAATLFRLAASWQSLQCSVSDFIHKLIFFQDTSLALVSPASYCMVRSFPKFHFESPKCLCIMDRAAGSSVLLQATREMHVDSDHC